MDLKEYVFSVVMVLSAFVLTQTWITRFGPSNAVVVVSAMLMVGALAAMLLSMDIRMKRMEREIKDREKNINFLMNSVENSLSVQLSKVVKSVEEAMNEFSKRIYK
ncbi:MAG: hypothetical protein ACXQS2_05455 [Methermicoccaceae archaeon]